MTLAFAPTPVEPLPRLTAALGGPRIFVKRDDLTGLALGGNKARKLERICADALVQGCDVLVTGGGIQSNHVRQTAAAARRIGMECHAILGGTTGEAPSGNHLLDVLLGATIEVVDAPGYDDVERAIVAASDRFRAEGRTPYAIPVGDTGTAGVQAYADAARELRGQRDDIDWIFVADGSGGTRAPDCWSVSVTTARASSASMSAPVRTSTTRCHDGRAPGRHRPQLGGGWLRRARRRHPRRVADSRRTPRVSCSTRSTRARRSPRCAATSATGESAARDNVLFWHTGGQPALFTSRYATQLIS